MSNITTVAMATLAATLAAVQPAAEAQGPDFPLPEINLSAGMDGMRFLYAHVHPDGFVLGDPAAGGITDENVRLVQREVPDGNGGTVLDSGYCFVGLPPVVSGQVTVVPFNGGAEPVSPSILIDDEGEDDDPDPDCPIVVLMMGPDQPFPRLTAGFHILLIRATQ